MYRKPTKRQQEARARAVESRGQIIRNEYKTPAGWRQAGKAYKVDHSKRRQGERIKAAAVEFCK
jgi:hypothetical protein